MIYIQSADEETKWERAYTIMMNNKHCLEHWRLIGWKLVGNAVVAEYENRSNYMLKEKLKEIVDLWRERRGRKATREMLAVHLRDFNLTNASGKWYA